MNIRIPISYIELDPGCMSTHAGQNREICLSAHACVLTWDTMYGDGDFNVALPCCLT